MTAEAKQRIVEPAGQGGVSGAVVTVLIDRVHARQGDVGVAQALALAGDGRPFSVLRRLDHWSSLAETVALFNAAALVTGDGAIGIHVGEELLHRADGTDLIERFWRLGSPEEAFKHIAPLVAYFEDDAEAVALEVADDHALIEVTPQGAETRHAHLCEMTRGLLGQIPAVYGMGPGEISESECSARGGRFCLYAVSWGDPAGESDNVNGSEGSETEGTPVGTIGGEHSDPVVWFTTRPSDRPAREEDDERVAELQTQLDRMTDLAQGAFASFGEPETSGEALLTTLAGRADAAVGTQRYLLMIRLGSASPLQLHWRGMSADDAQHLAEEVWRTSGHGPSDGRVVIDIASADRLYGRLVLPVGGSELSSGSAVLEAYARYAAGTLDIFGVLSEAQQSDATARTLLSFAEAVSRVTNLADLVQLLADTVPAVTDCDHATVYLWDRDEGRLVPRGRTTGFEVAAGLGGRIVPVPRPDRSATPAETVPPATDDEVDVQWDVPLVENAIHRREVMVIDRSTEDPTLRRLLEASDTAASVVAPLFANGEFLGVISANFALGRPAEFVHRADLHERLSGVADQAATALQNLELLEKVSHMAWHDALTGLPNRRLFEDRVEQELVRSRRVGEAVCMFFVDLDYFKTVNDTLGHAAGDDLIQQVSQRLVDTVRRQDTVARVGGDEFAILLPGLAEQDDIDDLAQRSLEALSHPFTVLGQQIETSASIGIAIAPDHGDSYDELLSRADAAMYRAKARGRNAFQMFSGSVTDPAAGTGVVDDATLRLDLVHALEAGQFFVLYQPYIDLRSAEVVGVEALVRWNHPVFGVLEPSTFIALAEESSVIVALDSWVLEQACAQARRWLDQGLDPLRISVNLATRDLADPALFAHIDHTLDEMDIDPTQLELEITERVVIDKSGPAKDNVDRLRRLGVRFSIDDFGTGNSSLNRIGSFPVSTLKIDQSFVQVLGPDGDNNALVSAIISMADRLGLACVAEGVETPLQSRMLLQRGCTTAQGYFFSPPLPADEVERMMRSMAQGDDEPT